MARLIAGKGRRARGKQSRRDPGGGPGGTAAHRGRTRARGGHVHRACRGNRPGQEHHLAAAAGAGAQRAGPPRRRGPVPARRDFRPVRLARRRRGRTDRGRSALPGAARPGHRRDREPGRRRGRRGRADRSGGQRVRDRRDELAGPRGPAALHRHRQGPARLRRGEAAARPAGVADRADDHQPGRARGRARGGAAARLRGHRRRTRTGAGSGGRPGLPRRRRRGRRPVGVRPGDPADPAADRRRGGRVHGAGQRAVRRSGSPAGAPGAWEQRTAPGAGIPGAAGTAAWAAASGTAGAPSTAGSRSPAGSPSPAGPSNPAGRFSSADSASPASSPGPAGSATTAGSPSTERRCRVTPDELLKQLYDDTLVGNKPSVLELTQTGLGLGMGPETLLYDALIPALEEVGARFERGDFFVPEMLIAGKAMAGALEILRPLLAETGAAAIGTVVMGTVKGDVHDIGKNLVNIMFEGAGFQVIDLGVQVAPEKFVDAVREHQPDIVGFSAFLTTTMPMFKANINALQKSGLRDRVIVMVGGAPVTQEYADVVGADGYAADASAAVVRAKELLQRRRAALPA